MKRERFVWRMLLVVWVLLQVLPGAAVAAEEGSSYPLWVGGVQVTDANKDDLTKAINAITPDAASGTAIYNAMTNTLLLNGFTYAGKGISFAERTSGINSSAAVYSELETFCITVRNSNRFSHTGATTPYSYGVYTTGHLEITAESTGTLTVSDVPLSGAQYQRSIGICLSEGDLIVNGGSLSAIAGDAEQISMGVWCFNGNVTVNEKGTLTGVGSNSAVSRGLCVFDLLAIHGGVAEGVAGKAQSGASISHGISTGSLVSTSDDGQLIGKADSAKESVGIYLWNSSTFARGHVAAMAGESMAENSYGFYLADNASFIIGGGDSIVVAIGNTAAFRQPPEIDAGTGTAKAWYGADETVAEASGEKSADDVAAYYAEQYVRIVCKGSLASDAGFPIPPIQDSAPVAPPLTMDHSRVAMWSVLTIVSIVGIVLVCWLDRKQER